MVSIESREWRIVPTHGCPPSPRYGHSSVLHQQRMYVLGGNDHQDEALSDVHVLDVGTAVGTAKIKTDGRLARALTSECGWLYRV